MNTRFVMGSLVLAMVLLGIFGCDYRGDTEDAASPTPEKKESAEPFLTFSDDGRKWRCELKGYTLAFLDPDNDGLSAACEVYDGDEHLKTVTFHHREYLPKLVSDGWAKQGGVYSLIAGLRPENIVGYNLLIPAKPPFTLAPTRTTRVTDREMIGSLCLKLREFSYHWSGVMWTEPIGPFGEPSAGGEVQRSMRIPEPLWLSLEIRLLDEPEPMTIRVYHLRTSYEFHEDGLVAVWRGEARHLSNDSLAYDLLRLLAPQDPEDERIYGLLKAETISWPVRYQATYFGGIRVLPHGKPWHPVTTEEKVRQVKALIEVHERFLLDVSSASGIFFFSSRRRHTR